MLGLLSLFLIFCIFLRIYFSINLESKTFCSGGRDTVLEFGEKCRYALLQGEDETILYDRDKNKTLSSGIISYLKKKQKIYIIARNNHQLEYIVFDFKNSEYKTYSNLTKMDKLPRNVFENSKEFNKVYR